MRHSPYFSNSNRYGTGTVNLLRKLQGQNCSANCLKFAGNEIDFMHELESNYWGRLCFLICFTNLNDNVDFRKTLFSQLSSLKCLFNGNYLSLGNHMKAADSQVNILTLKMD